MRYHPESGHDCVLGKLNKQKEPEDRSSIPTEGFSGPQSRAMGPARSAVLLVNTVERSALGGGNLPLHGHRTWQLMKSD